MKTPSPYYRVSLKAIVFDEQRRILVMQLADKTWELPGGGWEHGESMQHCLRREVMEELGVGIEQINFEDMYPYSGKTRSGNQGLKLAIPVILTDHDFQFEDGVVAARFVTATELSKLDMHDDEGGIKTHISRIWPD